MKAVLCRSYGPPENLKLEEVEDPAPCDNEVLIDIYTAGLNFPDTLQIQGKYQFQPPFPFTPGSEVGGKVAAVGSKVTRLKPGDRVMSMTGVGGMAEQVVVGEGAPRLIPDTMDFPTAASFGMIYGTSYHALKQRADLQPGETLLVLGAAGGVGMSAIEIGKAMGARVIAAASTDEKLAVAKELGADELVSYADGEIKQKVKDLTSNKGADVIYDPVGGDLFDQAARCINWKGRLLVIGFASGRIPKLPTNLALLKGSACVGVFWGDFVRREPDVNDQNFKELFELHAEGKLKPKIGALLPLDGFVEGLNLFVHRKALGKIVLEVRKE